MPTGFRSANIAMTCLLACFLLIVDQAQCDDELSVKLSTETLLNLGSADRAIKDLDGFLQAIKFERPAIIGTNYFAISVGGIDAIRDLEEGRGVDPETFAGLYAGFARPEIAKHLNLRKESNKQGQVVTIIDAADGRLRYKSIVIRLYSRKRLQELFDRRESFHLTNTRQRRAAFADFTNTRRRVLGAIDRTADTSEVDELSQRFEQLNPILNDLQASLQTETNSNSILRGTGQHFFGLSIGGIDTLRDLNERHAVDPETLGAIYAGHILSDELESIQVTDSGRIEYSGSVIHLYPVEHLKQCFKLRDRLSNQSK